MRSKITLYSDKSLIEEVKAFASEHNISVSKLVNTFFINLVHQNRDSKYTKSIITDKLTGILKDNDIDKRDYHKYLEEKYL